MMDDVLRITRLLPALVKLFVIIICGYLAGRWGVVNDANSTRLGLYLSRVALPAMLFYSMSTLDFAGVNWMFLASVLAGKTGLFIITAVVTYFSQRPVHWGKVGLFAIFATQSNDFALCYPIGRY